MDLKPKAGPTKRFIEEKVLGSTLKYILINFLNSMDKENLAGFLAERQYYLQRKKIIRVLLVSSSISWKLEDRRRASRNFQEKRTTIQASYRPIRKLFTCLSQRKMFEDKQEFRNYITLICH